MSLAHLLMATDVLSGSWLHSRVLKQKQLLTVPHSVQPRLPSKVSAAAHSCSVANSKIYTRV